MFYDITLRIRVLSISLLGSVEYLGGEKYKIFELKFIFRGIKSVASVIIY